MVCFKGWIKFEGEPSSHNVRLPKKPDIIDPSYIFDGYENPNQAVEKKAVIETLTLEELAEKDISELTDDQLQCYDVHKLDCPFSEPHPLVKENQFYDFKQQYIDNIVEETAAYAEDPDNDLLEYNSKFADKRLKADPKMPPLYVGRHKMCTKFIEDPTGALNSDGFPTILTDLIMCPLNQQCCGAYDVDEDNNVIEQEGCCNKTPEDGIRPHIWDPSGSH